MGEGPGDRRQQHREPHRQDHDDATGWCVYSVDFSYVQIKGNTCINTGTYGIRNESSTRTPEFVTVRDNLIIDKNVSSIYGSGVSLGSCTKCVVEGNIFRGPIPSGGVVTGATADDVVYGNTIDPSLSSAIPFVFGPGTNNDIPLLFDQGTGTDPRFVWDDNPGQFEFDLTGTLNDSDVKINSDGTNPTVYIGKNAGPDPVQTHVTAIQIPQYGRMAWEIPFVSNVTGGTEFSFATAWATFNGIRDNNFGKYYNVYPGMGKINQNTYGVGDYWEMDGAVDCAVPPGPACPKFEWNMDFVPEPEHVSALINCCVMARPNPLLFSPAVGLADKR